MKYLLLAAALTFGLAGSSLAQTSAPSSNPSAHSQPSTSPNGPNGAAMSEQGKVKPCNKTTSGTSDRTGGSGTRSTASSESNSGGNVSGSGC